MAATLPDCVTGSSEQHIPLHTQAEESPGVDDSDGEVAENLMPSRDIVHNSTPQQTALRRSSAARTKGGNIATAADSLVHEITAERGVFDNSVLCKIEAIVLLAGLVSLSPTPFQELLHETLPYSDMQPEALSQQDRAEMCAACFRCMIPPNEDVTRNPMVVEIDVSSRVTGLGYGMVATHRRPTTVARDTSSTSGRRLGHGNTPAADIFVPSRRPYGL